MTKQEVINLINQFIIENGNNEITAEVLNPILRAIINQPNDLIGDFNNTPIQGLTVVDKINALSSMIGNVSGVQIYTGALPPDQSPPTTFNIGDFYAQFSATYLGLWQFDGNTWVRQGNIINDGAVDSSLTWSSQKITDIINNKDGILSIGDLEINGNLLTIPAAATWRIAGITYSNQNSVTLSIPYTAIGYERLDNLVANTNNTFEIVQGVPTNGIAVKPLDQPNKVTVTTISVTDATINNQNDATNFIKKDEQVFYNSNINSSGVIGIAGAIGLNAYNLKITSALAPATSISNIIFSNNFEGKRILIWNATNANIQIVSGQTFIQNVTITPNQIIEFIYSGGKLYLEGGVGGATEKRTFTKEGVWSVTNANTGIYTSLNNGSATNYSQSTTYSNPSQLIGYNGGFWQFNFPKAVRLAKISCESAVVGGYSFAIVKGTSFIHSEPSGKALLYNKDTSMQSFIEEPNNVIINAGEYIKIFFKNQTTTGNNGHFILTFEEI